MSHDLLRYLGYWVLVLGMIAALATLALAVVASLSIAFYLIAFLVFGV